MWRAADHLVLAEQTPWTRTGEVLIAVGTLIVVILVGTWLLLYLRSRLRSEDDADANRTPFTLQDLRELHKAGHLSDAEFETAKARILAMFQAEPAHAADEAKADPNELFDDLTTDEPMNPPGSSIVDAETDSDNDVSDDDAPPDSQKNPGPRGHNPPL